jgi:deazaflavin-dependent oxidoreductase (nitroreductase family)
MARVWGRIHAALYRRTGGRFVPKWFGAPVLVLETVGARSGQPRATPVIYARRGDDLIVMASNAGHPKTPAWWINLKAAGEGTAVIGGERRRVRPRVVSRDEDPDAWRALLAAYPAANDYLRFTDREMPLVVLERIKP